MLSLSAYIKKRRYVLTRSCRVRGGGTYAVLFQSRILSMEKKTNHKRHERRDLGKGVIFRMYCDAMYRFCDA